MSKKTEDSSKGPADPGQRPAPNLESTQMRSGQSSKDDGSGGISTGQPDPDPNRPGVQGRVSQQSGAETDGGAPSAQTSGASSEKGQL